MLYRIIILNLLIDILAFWFDPGGLTAMTRIVLIYGWFFILFFKKQINIHRNFTIIFFIIYVLILILFSNDSFISFRNSLKVFSPFLMFLVGSSLVKSEIIFKKYIKQFIYVYIIIIVNTLVSNVFGLGTDDYTRKQDYVVGGLNDMWNIYTYSLLMLPLLLHYIRSKNKKYLTFLALVIFILLLVSLKRIAILGVVIGYVLYYYKVGIKAKYIKSLTIIAVLFVIASPLYLSLLESRLETRRETNDILSAEGYRKELRYMEVFLLINSITDGGNLKSTVFGRKPFDSRAAFNDKLGDGRQLHVDYNNIIYTIGLLGLALYIAIYRKIYLKLNNYSKKLLTLKNKRYKPHLALAFALLATSLVTSFAGQMDQITFRMMIFMTIGCVFGLIDSEMKRKNTNNG